MEKKKITKKELDKFLRKHKLWLADDPKGERADLRGANLWGANLWGANLSEADLSEANLRGANLSEANLSEANLRVADLRGANLRGANLRGANLRGANLRVADLRGADLRGADLWGANLWGANLWGADLRGAKNMSLPLVCPEKGSFTAFKKADMYIVELFVPASAKRSSATSRKCRCDRAKVVSITNLDGSSTNITTVHSSHDRSFVYTVGEYVKVDNFEDDRWAECAPGIHFFITRQEAVEY